MNTAGVLKARATAFNSFHSLLQSKVVQAHTQSTAKCEHAFAINYDSRAAAGKRLDGADRALHTGAHRGARAVLDNLPYHPAGDAQRKVDTGGGADSCGSRACVLHIDALHACFGRLKSRQKCVFFFF